MEDVGRTIHLLGCLPGRRHGVLVVPGREIGRSVRRLGSGLTAVLTGPDTRAILGLPPSRRLAGPAGESSWLGLP